VARYPYNLFCTKEGGLDRSCLVDSNVLIVDAGRRVQRYVKGESPATLLDSVYLLARSHSGHHILVAARWTDEHWSHWTSLWLYGLTDSSRVELNLRRKDILDAVFSPDDRYLAMRHSTGQLYPEVVLLIYDLKTGETLNTCVPGAGSLIWLEDSHWLNVDADTIWVK
jgi:hypothetical protein